MTNKNESAAYQTLKAKCFKPHDRIERIENLIGSGMPDVTYCIDGHNDWIEVKAPRNMPKRETTPVLVNNEKVSQEQKNWFLAQKNAGGQGWIWIDTPSHMLLISGHKADNVNQASLIQLMLMADWCAKIPVPNERWLELRRILRRG